jgi:hypothetical protein
MINSESTKTEILSMPMSLAAFNPNKRASYSLILFFVSNSNLHDRGMNYLEGEMRTIPSPEPSLEHEPSKNIFHTEFSIFFSYAGVIFPLMIHLSYH